jgi:hypothetical protein
MEFDVVSHDSGCVFDGNGGRRTECSSLIGFDESHEVIDVGGWALSLCEGDSYWCRGQKAERTQKETVNAHQECAFEFSAVTNTAGMTKIGQRFLGLHNFESAFREARLSSIMVSP